MRLTAERIRVACRHLRTRDPVMRAMIDKVGPFTLRFNDDRFAMLVRSIISQQISTTAATRIRDRLIERAGDEGVTAEWIARRDPDELRAVGLSSQKTTYLLDLADKVRSGDIELRTIGRLSDERIIEMLTRVRGIGVWTAQMFLIFSLGRPDVFPHGDLGIRVSIRDRYGLADLPDMKTGLTIAAPWRPYATVASWYCWRMLEAEPKPRP
ncbi:MAG: DNA-3-methyladenine glycosylase 2 family protein [Planctomycetes bacterium]|nr:DNA-3-methyladenine glycosylase 2 family protein [Planctomycetota bacterium]